MKNIIKLILWVLGTQGIYAQSHLWTQSAHPNALQVNGVTFSTNGEKVLSGTNCHPAKIRLYDAISGNITWDYTVPNNYMCMMGVGLSSNGKYCATIEEMGNLFIFDYMQSPPVLTKTIDMGTSYGFSLAFSPNNQKIAVGGSNSKLQTYKLSDGSLDLNIANAHSAWVTSVAYSSNSYWIASGGSDDKVKLWDSTGVLLKTLSSHTGDITSLKFSPDNQRLFSASKDNTIKVWELSTGNLLQTIVVSAKDVNAIDLSPNGQMLVSASGDSLLRVWSTIDYQLVSTFGIQDSGQYICVAWSPLGDKIAAGTEEGSGAVIVYNVSGLTDVEKALSEHQIAIYPNPIVAKSIVRFPVNTVKSLEILDITGKRVAFYSDLLQREDVILDSSHLPKGYLIGQFINNDNQVLVCHFWVR